MIKQLLIASTNIKKHQRLSNTIETIFPEITISTVSISDYPTCQELGSDETENAFLKAKHYFLASGLDALSEDDGIYFNNKNLESPGMYLRRESETGKELSSQDLFRFWGRVLRGNKKVTGLLVKAFCIYTEEKVFSKKISIPVEFIKVKEEFFLRKSYNPLNSIMKPKGYKNSFANFSADEDAKYASFLANNLESLVKEYCNI